MSIFSRATDSTVCYVSLCSVFVALLALLALIMSRACWAGWAGLAGAPAELTVAPAPTCRLRYTYEASVLEKRWVANIASYATQSRDWSAGCTAAEADKPHFAQWLNFCDRLARERDYLQVTSQPLSSVLSYFAVEPVAPGANCSAAVKHIPIEPLTVALRHPHFPCLDKGRLIKHETFSWILLVPPRLYTSWQRAYFFDLGATYYNRGLGKGFGLGTLKQFITKYRAIGVEFDEVFAWEATPLDHKLYWRRVDANMTHKMHLFNTPTSANLTDPMGALQMVLSVVHPNDFVVFKLDIDNQAVEIEMVLSILRTPALVERIDEMFWEHHVRGSPMQWHGWGNLGEKQRQRLSSRQTWEYGSIQASYRLFTNLREAGIRAHSWI